MGNEQSTPGATSSSPDAASSAHASPLQAAADARDVAWSPCATAKNACPAPRVGAGAVLDDGTLVVMEATRMKKSSATSGLLVPPMRHNG